MVLFTLQGDKAKLEEEVFTGEKKVIKTAAMECGTKYEPDAAKLYFDTNMVKLCKSGFLINPSVSWIAPQCTQE